MTASNRIGSDGHTTPKAVVASFTKALITDGPAAELGDAADAFGWLIGGWTAKVQDIEPDGRVRQGEGEWWSCWVLEGRAVQDVWICPPRGKRSANDGDPKDSLAAFNRYGTAIRWFDRKTLEWRVVWVNPVSGIINTLAGKRTGDQIILLGTDGGEPIRWSLNEIRSDSFIWRGEERVDGQWRLSAEFQLRRIV